MCLTRIKDAYTIVQMTIALSFGKHSVTIPHPTILELSYSYVPLDVAVFALVIIQTRLIRSRFRGMGGANVLDRVSKDSKMYFGVIATSHFVIVAMFILARVGFLALALEFNVC
jgi:hypothetical protein